MSIVVVGFLAYDTVETPNGKVEEVLGGGASYFSIAARFFSPVSIVAVVGTDYRPRISSCSRIGISMCAE